MTESEFEGMTFPTEEMAYEAGYKHYGLINLESSRNPDGSWYVYPKGEE